MIQKDNNSNLIILNILLSSMFIVYFVFRHLPNVALLINRLIDYMYSYI